MSTRLLGAVPFSEKGDDVANHSVKMTISHAMDVGNVDVEFQVRNGTRLMGTVKISKGTIDWRPAGGKPRKASWTEFAEWMMSAD
jgi:hypothetical protein